MLNKFLKSLSILLLLNLLIKPFWVLFVDRLVQEQVGNVAFGMYQTFASFSLIFSIILDPGLKNFYNTSLSKDISMHSRDTGRYILIKLLLGGVFFVLIGAIAFSSEDYRQNWQLFLLLAINHILLSFLLFFRSTLTGLGYYRRDSVMSVVDRVIMVITAVPIFFTDWFQGYKTVEAFAWVHTIGYIGGIIICFIFLGKHTFEINFKFDFKGFGPILKRSFPFALFTGLMSLYIYADFIMLERLLPNGFESAGLYRKSYRFLEASSMFALLFGNLLLPIFSTIIGQKGDLNSMIKVVFKILVIPSFFVVISCFGFREEIMELAYPGEKAIVAQSFGWLMTDYIAITLFYLFGTVLTAAHELKLLNVFAGIGVVVNIGLNAFLIPRIGIMGAVIATLSTHGAVAILQMSTTLHKYNIVPRPAVIARVIAYIGFSILALYTLQQTRLNWIYQLSILSALSLTFALLFKVFSFKQLLVLLKNKVNE
jgi:O-antigen/teichoic acid export membrane protein